ncbi:CCR4-Not complex caf1 ribonuclease subunit Caf1 [Apophysomyces sp. BC1015]|nr:CCR4-Not complex caf1 ribonuclease subunit Caf1 [Apophysomyces sp. BC1015]
MSESEQTNKDLQRQISAEYKQWKSTAPYLYDLLMTDKQDWPSLTCQWMPTNTRGEESVSQELMIGTLTNDEEPNYVKFLSVDVANLENKAGEKALHARIEIKQRIRHDGEVNRARYQPSNPDIIATQTRDGDVLVFDRTKVVQDTTCDPALRLKGHTKEGYGLAWSPHRPSHLLSASFDKTICQWDIRGTAKQDRVLEPYQRYEGHVGCVADVHWNAADESMFASVADDKTLMIWDTRSARKPTQSVQAHDGEVNSVAFHPRKEWLLATGSSDKTIGLFDIRKLNNKLHSLEMHQSHVRQVAWSPHDGPILASCGLDRRLMVWDLERIGEEQSAEDAEDGPPELMFVHAGHTHTVSEFSWNPLDRWTIASVADDNILHVWKMTSSLCRRTDADTDMEYLQAAPTDLE